MLVRKKNIMYTTGRKKVIGRGFIENLKGIGSYIFQNKDLIAKPMLEAVGNIGALAATEGARAIINRLKNKNKKQISSSPNKSQEIINKLTQPLQQSQENSIGNIIGSGIKKF